MTQAVLLAPTMIAAEASAADWGWTEEGRGWRAPDGCHVEARCNLGGLGNLAAGARLYLGRDWNTMPGCDDLAGDTARLGLRIIDPSGRRGLSPSVRRSPQLTRIANPASRGRSAKAVYSRRR